MCAISFQEEEVFFIVRLSKVSSSWIEEGATQILLAGAWVREYGFEAGRKYVVDITAGHIVISLIDAEDVEGMEVESYAP